MKRALLLLVPTLLCCEGTPGPVTQVVVVVGGDPRVSALEVRVRSETALVFAEDRTFALQAREPDGRRLPTSFTIVPNDRDPAPRFRVEVIGLRKDGKNLVPFVRRIVNGLFTDGKTTLLPMVLDAACADERCGCSWDDATCDQSCEPPGFEHGARCASIPKYVRLAEVEPGKELETLDSGGSECEPGEALGPEGTCLDFDECAFGMDDCDHEPFACVNELAGRYGFECRCPTGTRGDGYGADGCQ